MSCVHAYLCMNVHVYVYIYLLQNKMLGIILHDDLNENKRCEVIEILITPYSMVFRYMLSEVRTNKYCT